MPGARVAVDGDVLALSTARVLRQTLNARNIALDATVDVLDAVWHDRPLPAAPIREHAAPYAGLTRVEKLAGLRLAMAVHGASHHIVSTLDDIAYLFNLRGADVEYNPVFVAHAMVWTDHATLFVGPGKVSGELSARLAQDAVFIAPYETWAAALATLVPGNVLLLDPRRVTGGTRSAVAAGVTVVEAINPTTLAKAGKTAHEVAHIRAAMEQDGAALCEFFSWLDGVLALRAMAPHAPR